MKKRNPSQSLFFYVTLLVLWGMAALYLLITFTPRFSLIGIALFIFVVIFSLTELFPFAPWISFLISFLVYSGVVYSLLESTESFLTIAGIGGGIFLAAALFAALFNRQIRRLRENQKHLQQVIDSLVVYDRKTSLMRWKFAQHALTTEILRGRRYETRLSLVLFEIWQKSQYTSEDLNRLHRQMAEIILETIRENIDIAFIGERIGLILPETGQSGAQILAGRLIQQFNRKLDARISAGIASFPKDAVTETEILKRAEEALKVAINTGQETVIFEALKEEEQEETGSGISETSSPSQITTGSAAGKEFAQEQGPAPDPRTKAEQERKEGSTQPIDLPEEQPEKQDYIQILKNINLAEDEWVIWVQGFSQMADLVRLEKEFLNLPHVTDIDFLFLQANHLVLRLRSSLADLSQAENPFPGWRIQKSDQDNHYLLLRAE